MLCCLPLLLTLQTATGLAADADPPDLYIAPYLQNVTPDAITVMWETTEPVIGIVEYGRNGKYKDKVKEPEAHKLHEIRIDGLTVGGTEG